MDALLSYVIIMLILATCFYYIDQMFYVVIEEKRGRNWYQILLTAIVPFLGWFTNQGCITHPDENREEIKQNSIND